MKKIILFFITIFFSFFWINKAFSDDLEFVSPLYTNFDTCSFSEIPSHKQKFWIFNDDWSKLYFITTVGSFWNVQRLYEVSLLSPYNCNNYNNITLLHEYNTNNTLSVIDWWIFYNDNNILLTSFSRIYTFNLINNNFINLWINDWKNQIKYDSYLNNLIYKVDWTNIFKKYNFNNWNLTLIWTYNNNSSINNWFIYNDKLYTFIDTWISLTDISNLSNFQFIKNINYTFNYWDPNFHLAFISSPNSYSNNYIYSYSYNKIYSIYVNNNLLYNSLTCETQLVNWPYNFDVKQWNVTDFISDDWTTEDFPFYSFKSWWAEYQLTFNWAKNFNNFNSWSILDENSSYTFKNIFTTSVKWARAKITSYLPIEFLYLDWTFVDDEFYFRTCWWLNEDYKIWKSQTSYTFSPTNCVELAFNKAFFSSNEIKDLRFWQRESQIIETEICYNEETWETFVLWELFTWDLDDIWWVNPNTKLTSIFQEKHDCSDFDIWCHLSNFFMPTLDFEWNPKTLSISNFIIDQLNTLFWYSDYLLYINILLPDTPNTNITLPFPYLNNQFQISLKYVDTTILPIEDKLDINAIQKTNSSILLLSFAISILYILFRIAVIIWIFYIFKLYYKYITLWVSSLFWPSLTKTDDWNVFSFWFYLLFLFFLFSTFYILFTYILQLDSLFLTIINYSSVFFTFLSLSFWDYDYFKNLTNFFFISLTTWILLYTVHLLTTKFLRIN